MPSADAGPGRGRMVVVGAINWDVSIFEDRFARPGEEVPVRRVEEFSGGKGANVAVAASRILGPGSVSLIGALGDDGVSGAQIVGLRDEGVSTDGVSILKGRRSGRAYIVVDSKGRKTIHTHFGANEELQPSHLLSRGAREAITKCSLAVIMDPPVKVALKAAGLCKEHQVLAIYSPGVRAREGLRALSKVIDLCGIIVLDSNELRNITGTRSVERALVRLRREHDSVTVIATLGERGCIISQKDGNTRVPGVNLSSLGQRAVNSTGSGDAFLGVFASYLMMGVIPPEAVVWGNLAGALKATRYETRGSPSRRELELNMEKLQKIRQLRQGSPGKRAS